MSLVGNARLAVQAFGILDGLLYTMGRVLQVLSGSRARLFKYYLVAQPVPEKPWLPPGKPERVIVKAVGMADAARVAFPRPAEVIRARYAQGGKCLAAYKDGEFLGFIWYNLGLYLEDEVRCRFLPLPRGRASWDYDVYIDPRHRFGRLFARLWDELNARLRDCGVRWTVSRISAFNAESRKSHTRLGARNVGTALFLCVGHVQVFWGTVKPYIHLSVRGDGPLLLIDTAKLLISDIQAEDVHPRNHSA